MKDKIKEAALWAVALISILTIVAMFCGGVAIVVMGVAHYLGGE